ncbi:TetR/AcrR family transcriptional regulator [Lysinibacillus sp. LZ02]|uniref:TetR/AcrR family transcriptional regulator n=1 Tax=Lysinibacillus sp. LZ02 TaxID=3420668 RepID=UPI003D35D4D7
MDKKDRTRILILAAAKRVFLEKGYKDTTIKLIAESAGLGYGTIYSHFKLGKEEVFATLIEEVMTPFYEIAQLTYTPRNKEQAYNFTYNNTYKYLTLAIQNKEIFKLIHEAKGMSELVNQKWEDITDKFIERISVNVEIVRSLGMIRNEHYHSEIVASFLYYLGERYLWELILDKTAIPIHEITRDIVTMYTHGLFK